MSAVVKRAFSEQENFRFAGYHDVANCFVGYWSIANSLIKKGECETTEFAREIWRGKMLDQFIREEAGEGEGLIKLIFDKQAFLESAAARDVAAALHEEQEKYIAGLKEKLDEFQNLIARGEETMGDCKTVLNWAHQ